MSEPCPHCGTPLPPDAPGGVCPYCVFKLGDSNTGPAPGAGAYPPLAHSPSAEELAASFPQLEILGLIGRGGMGVVYKARQANLDRLVALKILPPDVGRDPSFAERFSREARALARLNHPNIVSIYDSGERDGLFYFIMEYVDGVNLREAIKAQQMSPEKALAIVPQICDALQYAHEEGVVHRDIKPENVLLDRKGRVKVADFGLAKLLGLASPDITLTGTYQAMGTLHYMAPEQYEKPQAVDHRADIYSLGVVFYELLTGKLPLGRFDLPSEKVQVDVRLDQVVLKTLEREPERRYQYASEVKTEVDSIAHAPRAAAAVRPPRPESVFSQVPPPPKQELTDAGRAALVLGIVALTIMPLLCGGGSLLAFAMRVGEAVWMPILLLMPLLLIGGVALIIVGLTSKRAVDDRAIPPEKQVSPALLRERAELLALWPARALLLLAIATWTPLFVALGQLDNVFRDDDIYFPLALATGVQIASTVLMIVASIRMRRLQNYGLAMTAAILAVLPAYFIWPLGVPIGIWTLIVLCRSDVQAMFGKELPAGYSPSRRPRLSIAAIALIAAAAVIGLPLVVMCAAGFTHTTMAPRHVSHHGTTMKAMDHASYTTEVKRGPENINWLDWNVDVPQLGGNVADVTGLYSDQIQQINAAMAKARTAYLEVEQKNTERKENELGHQVVTVKPFSKDLTRLEDEFWTEVDDVVTDNSLRGMLREKLPLRGEIFPFGSYQQSVELWKVGAWYQYKYENSGPQRGPDLPRSIKHLWQTPETRP